MSEDQLSEAQLRFAERDRDAALSDAAERVKIQWSVADATLKACVLANGGAMVALFTFIGNVIAKTPAALRIDAGSLRSAFAFFVAGLLFALFAHLFAFLSQDRFYHQAMMEVWRHQAAVESGKAEKRTGREARMNRDGARFYLVGLATIALSMGAFVGGCWFALDGVLAG